VIAIIHAEIPACKIAFKNKYIINIIETGLVPEFFIPSPDLTLNYNI